MATVQEIITEQRLLVRDTVTQKPLWTDQEMIYALNETMRQIGIRSPIWDDSGDFNIALEAGKARYYYDSCILTIEDVTRAYDSRLVEKTTYTWLDTHNGDNWRDDAQGYPKYYIENPADRSLIVYPIPSTDNLDTLLLNVYRTPKSNYTTSNMDTTTIRDIDLNLYRNAVLIGMQIYLYRKVDSNTFREDMAAYAEAKFHSLVGAPVDMKTLENRRANSNRNLHYKPFPYTQKTKRGRSYRDKYTRDIW